MGTSTIAILLLLAAAAAASLGAQEQQPAPCLQRAEADRAYSHDRLLLMIQDNSRTRAEFLIRSCGISVPFTNELERELRTAGAVESVIAAVREVAPTQPREPEVPTGRRRIQQKVNPKDGLAYIWVPAGTFRLGCEQGETECLPNEQPARDGVMITKGFWLGQTEVTQAAFERVTGQNPSYAKAPNFPVESVSWHEASAYCNAIGGRLPTEAEWEYAAKAGLSGRSGNPSRVAWHKDNSGASIHEVREKEANSWGFHDMLGNVWEWTSDWYSESLPDGRQDPTGRSPGTEKVLRGGSWESYPGSIRPSLRYASAPVNQASDIGFRCIAE